MAGIPRVLWKNDRGVEMLYAFYAGVAVLVVLVFKNLLTAPEGVREQVVKEDGQLAFARLVDGVAQTFVCKLERCALYELADDVLQGAVGAPCRENFEADLRVCLEYGVKPGGFYGVLRRFKKEAPMEPPRPQKPVPRHRRKRPRLTPRPVSRPSPPPVPVLVPVGPRRTRPFSPKAERVVSALRAKAHPTQKKEDYVLVKAHGIFVDVAGKKVN